MFVSTFAASPTQEHTPSPDALGRAVKLLATGDSKSLSEAAKIIRSAPKQSWAIVDEIAASLERTYDNRLSSALYLVLSQVDSKKIIAQWGTDIRLEGALLREIANRLGPPPRNVKPSLPMDRQSGLSVFAEAVSNDRTRLEALKNLGRLSKVRFDEKLVVAIIGCLDDETIHERQFCCGVAVESIREMAKLVLSQHVVNHEQELAQLLDDARDYRRRCGVEIVAGDLQVISRNGDRVLALVNDESEQVRKMAIRKLPLLTSRANDVVTTLIDSVSKTAEKTAEKTAGQPAGQVSGNQAGVVGGVVYALHEIFPHCDEIDQRRIADWLITLLLDDERIDGHAASYAHWLRGMLPELDQAALDDSLRRLLEDFNRTSPPVAWQLRLLSAAGPRAVKVAPDLRRALETARPTARPAIAAALYQVAKDAEEVLPYYQAALKGDDKQAHYAALNGAKELGAAAAPLVPLLVPHLDESKGNYRYIFALRDIGPPAAAAIPELERLYERAEKSTKKYVVKALRAIRDEPASAQ